MALDGIQQTGLVTFSNNSHYMTTYELHELILVAKDTYKYSDVKTDIEL